jgi:predicted AlkP superfamily phosphohydrolase/phosphomutase
MKPKPKIVIIGLDAAVMTLVRPWVEQGHLPNLAALIAKGISGELESVMPPLTPAAWTSLMTGKNPGKHGIYKFVEHIADSYSFQYTNGSNRRAETVWKMANRAGYTVGVMNTPFTYPPEKLDGFQISGIDTPSPESAFVHPPELKKELEEKFGKLLMDSRLLGAMTSLEKRARMLEEFAKSDEQWSQVALYLMENHPQDIMMFTYMSIDTVEHHFWQYMDKGHFSHDPEGAELFRHAIREVYQRLDATIGEIVRRLDSSAHVLVVSDHGQEAITDRTLYINRILHQAGLLAYQPVNRRGALLRSIMSPVHAWLRHHLTHHQKQLISSLFPKLRDSTEAIVTSYSEIDWSRTQAFCYENWTCSPSVMINLKGVKPQGIVEIADYDAVIEKVRAALYAIKDPRTGVQIIANAYRWDEIYEGPYADRAADLTLQWWGSSRFNVKPSLRHESHLPPLRLEKHEPLRDPEWSGHHTFDGMLVASGPGFKAGETVHGARLIDIAPTLLHLLGLPVPDDMDGRVLEEVINSPNLPHPARTVPVPAAMPEPALAGREYDYSREEAAQVEDRLKNLGYLE